MADDKKSKPVKIFKNETRPEYDPENPQFDQEKYNAFIKYTGEQIRQQTEALINSYAAAVDLDFLNDTTETFKNIIARFTPPELKEAMAKFAAAMIANYESLTPYLAEELKKPEYKDSGLTVDNFLDEHRGNNEELDALKDKAWAAARAARDAAAGKDKPPKTPKRSKKSLPAEAAAAPIWEVLYHLSALDNLSLISPKRTKKDKITGTLTATAGTGNNLLTITAGKGTSLGIQTDKLKRHCETVAYNADAAKIYFPLDEYMRKLGYKIDIDEAAEDPEKEAKRAGTAWKDGRNKVKKELENLYNASFHFKNPLNKADFYDKRIIIDKGIKGNTVSVTLHPDYFKILKGQRTITQLHRNLYRIDARDPNTYRIGVKICLHGNNTANIMRGRSGRLGVISLLAQTDLPTIETVNEQRASWRQRIKAPFEGCLNELVKLEVLRGWKYTHAKGESPLTEAEADKIENYDTFSALYIDYEFLEAPEHEGDVQRKIEATEKYNNKIAAQEERNRQLAEKAKKRAEKEGVVTVAETEKKQKKG